MPSPEGRRAKNYTRHIAVRSAQGLQGHRSDRPSWPAQLPRTEFRHRGPQCTMGDNLPRRIGNSIGLGRVSGERPARSPTPGGPPGARRPELRAPPCLGGRPDGVARGRPVAAGRGDRSDALVGRTRAPNVPAHRRGVGVRLSGLGGPRRVVAWRPVQTVQTVQTVLGPRADSARRRGLPSRRGLGRCQPWRGDDRGRHLGLGRLGLTAHPAGAVGVPAIVPRRDVPLVGMWTSTRARNSSGSTVSVPAVGPSDLSDR